MSWLNKQSFWAHVALSLVAGFVMGVSAEVLADTVYTWQTDDGTVSFTDDQKHVPARYRDRVQAKSLQGLEGYYRYTPVESRAAADTAAAAGETPAVSAPAEVVVVPGAGVSVMTSGTRYGTSGVIVPVGEAPPGDEPIVIESRRVQRDDSMATSHETVVRQGDRVISMRRNESSHRDGTGMVPPID